MLITLAVFASVLVGFTSLAQPAGAISTIYQGSCPSQTTYDLGWYLSHWSGYVYHIVEDDYFAGVTSNGYCVNTQHVAVDTCNAYTCFSAQFEAWLPYWAEIMVVQDYGFVITSAVPYRNTQHNGSFGVESYQRNVSSRAWCDYPGYCANSYYGYPDPDGSETERGPLGVYDVYKWYDTSTGGYNTTVTL